MTKSFNYYPYGGLMGESTGSDAQPYKYNGKELDRHSGLDWYDYGARWYDGVRFNTMDRFSEKYPDLSPYSYCAGNPINAIDINGDSNTKGTLNQRSVGIAHEFGHVILFLRNLSHSHSANGDFIYGRQWNVMKKFGYDYVDR